jgi:hypothetical protein
MGLKFVRVAQKILGFVPNTDLVKMTVSLTIYRHCGLICAI